MSFTVISPFRLNSLIDDQKLFDPMLLQDALRFVERRADSNCDEIVLRHHRAYRLIEVSLEPGDPLFVMIPNQPASRALPAIPKRGTSS